MSERGRVIIVDDDAAGAEELEHLLVQQGYAVDRQTSGGDVLDALARSDADIVLLDTHLEHSDSFVLLTELRKGPGTPDIPVIFMSTLDDVEAKVKGLESGDDLIVKPFDTHEVLARIERQVTVSKVRLALRESEAKFRSVMESAIDAIISADSEGRIRSWNSAATALFGFTETEVIGEPIELIIPERFREAHQQGIRRVTSGGPSHVIGQTVELAAIRRDGSEFPVELSLATWFLDDQRYYTGIIRDISERKQAEQRFRSVTESAYDAIISADHEGKIVSWNQAATRILGYSEEEAVGQRLEIIIPEKYHEAHRQGMARHTKTGEGNVIGTTVELSACTKNGEEVPIELSLSTWTVRDERFYTGIIRDIGERKKAEEALRQSEQALRDRQEELKQKNAELEETLTQLREMHNQLIVQEKMASLGKLSAGMAHELNNPASAAQRGAAQLQGAFSRLQGIQLRLGEQQLDGAQIEKLVELYKVARIRVEYPTVMKALTRSDREAELEEWLTRRGVEVSGDLVPSLVNLEHRESDLETLQELFPGSQFGLVVDWLSCMYAIYTLVEEINLGAGRVTELVKALKTYTHMDQVPVQSVDIHEGLENTLIILNSKLKDGVTVEREYAGDLPRIQAHVSGLNQVWTNLIDNAIDAMDGQGTLVIRTKSQAPWLTVEIEDDGPGIPEEIQSKIFDPFFTTKGPGEGTGLGLNLSRNLVVQKHGGQMSVESAPGRTCFTVRLPLNCDPVA